ncbi:MAG TPA: DinB family protein [Vicinamibacterales bacterium]|nr:DinB family protein [Vicinamibacterales bacterium]
MSAALLQHRPAAERAGDAGVALVRLLDRLARTVRAIPSSAYRARPSQLSGSVGEHVRHCLDHVAALVDAALTEHLSYDHRLRGTAIEISREAALDKIDGLSSELMRLVAVPLTRPLAVDVLLERDGAQIVARSSLGRELAYLVQHTVHHCAVISLLLERLGIPVEADLGLAPSSPARH